MTAASLIPPRRMPCNRYSGPAVATMRRSRRARWHLVLLLTLAPAVIAGITLALLP